MQDSIRNTTKGVRVARASSKAGAAPLPVAASSAQAATRAKGAAASTTAVGTTAGTMGSLIGTTGSLNGTEPTRRPGRKPSPPHYYKISLNVADPVYNRLVNMADRRQIPLTELLRRSLATLDAFDRLLLLHPSGHIEFVIEGEAGAKQSFPVNVPVGEDAMV